MGTDLVLETEHFTRNELACHCSRCEYVGMDGAFMEHVESLRRILDRPLMVSSGFRCAYYNEIVSHTGPNGPHTTRRAIDFAVGGEEAYRLIQVAFGLGFTGIGINQYGPLSKRLVHLDTLEEADGRPRPRVWTY